MNKWMKTTLIVSAASGAIGLIALLLFYQGYLQFNHPSNEQYPIRGIDVSHHQHTIDWAAVQSEGIQFAFIKATEGGDFKDTAFAKNWQEARSNGFDVGAYHFFTFCKSGEEQAANFIQTVPVETAVLPPVIDLEYGGNCQLTQTDEEVIREIRALEKLLFQTYGKRSILYVTKEFYEDHLLGEMLLNPIWIRDIYEEPQLKDGRDWLFWQYANRGRLNGIDTYVDLNVFQGTQTEYEKLLQ